MVRDYESESDRDALVDLDELVITEEKITIEFGYPLSVNVYMEFKIKEGFTNMDLFRYVYEGYKKIAVTSMKTDQIHANIIPFLLIQEIN